MIKQAFSVESYWKVIVFYNLDYDLFYIVEDELLNIGFSLENIDALYDTMSSRDAKAVTCSSLHHRTSILLFNQHNTKTDYINSIVHEAEHVKQSMLKAYRVEDKGEPPAYTIGYIVGRMWEVVGKKLLRCSC